MKKIILALLVLGTIAVSASADQNTTQDVVCVIKVRLGSFQVKTPKSELQVAQATLEQKGWSIELQKVVCARPVAKGAAKKAPSVAIATLIAVQQNSAAIAGLKDCACKKTTKHYVQKHKTKKKVSKKHRRQKKIAKRQRRKAVYVLVKKPTVPFCQSKKGRLLKVMNIDKWYRDGCGKRPVEDDDGDPEVEDKAPAGTNNNPGTEDQAPAGTNDNPGTEDQSPAGTNNNPGL